MPSTEETRQRAKEVFQVTDEQLDFIFLIALIHGEPELFMGVLNNGQPCNVSASHRNSSERKEQTAH